MLLYADLFMKKSLLKLDSCSSLVPLNDSLLLLIYLAMEASCTTIIRFYTPS